MAGRAASYQPGLFRASMGAGARLPASTVRGRSLTGIKQRRRPQSEEVAKLVAVSRFAGRSGGEGRRATADKEWHTGGLARVPFGNVQAVMKNLNQTTDWTRSVASKAAG